jgi:O-antigen/teichoic acid export membrane protein
MNGRNLIRTLKDSEILRNTSILVSGTALAQVIPVILQPLLRRYYSAETFGAYSVYLSLIGIFSIIASFKYELAIVLPRKDRDATSVLILSILISLIFSIFLALIIIVWEKNIAGFMNLPDEYSLFLILVPAGVFLFSLYQTFNNWLTRKKSFVQISVNKFTRRIVEGTAQVGLKNIAGTGGLILGDILGHSANVVSGLLQSRKKGLNGCTVSLIKIKYVARKYSDFPKFNVIPSFMSACSFLLPAIMLNKFYSTAITGYFDLSKLLLSVPLALISTSLSNVLLQSLSEKYNLKQSLKKDLLPVLGLVSLVVAAEVIVILLYGVELFKFIFGDNWEFSGRISQILVWSYAMNFFVASFSTVFVSLQKIKILSLWQIIYFFSIISLGFFRNQEFLDFIKIFVGIEITCYTVIILLMTYIVLSYEMRLDSKAN